MRFLASALSFVGLIGLILHILSGKCNIQVLTAFKVLRSVIIYAKIA